MSVKIYMLANAYVDDNQYVKGLEYDVDSYTYKAIGKSCCLSNKRPKWVKNNKPKGRLNIVDRKIKIKPKTFLVIKTQGFGNVIQITPAIQKIHELFPDCKIDFLCDDTKVDVLKGWEILNKIYEYPADIEKVREAVYDCCLIGVPGAGDERVLHSFRAKYVLMPNIRALMIQHEVVVNMQPLEFIGWSGVNIHDTFIPLSRKDRAKARKNFPGKKYLAVCAGYFPSAQWSRKNWGYKKYARLIELLRKRYRGYKIVVMGTDADVEPYKLLKDKSNVINAVGKYTINESAAILERCKFLIVNDTGLSHVAGAVGCKVYTLFGPTSIVKNHPWRNSTVITLDLECAPCQYTQRWATCTDWQCLDIKPFEIMRFIKPEKRKKIRHELGVIMANHDRYSIVLSCLHSLYHCRGVKDVKFIFINDNSEKQTTELLEAFQAWHGKTEIIKHNTTHGRDLYHKTINEGLEAADDCRYIMFMPDDGLYNPWLFEVIGKSYKYLTGQVKCISYWRDDRPSGRGKETEGVYDKHFDVLKYMDGFMCLFEREYLDGLEIHGRNCPGGSSIWWNIQLQMRTHAYKILVYKDTLAEHIGNIKSSMHPHDRITMPINAIKLNMWNKPEILKGE